MKRVRIFGTDTWQLDHFPTPREQAALGDQMDPTDLENALPVRASSDDAGDFDVVWMDPPPHFNGIPTMYPEIAEGRDPIPSAGTIISRIDTAYFFIKKLARL